MQSEVLAAFVWLYIDKITQIKNFQSIIITLSLQRALVGRKSKYYRTKDGGGDGDGCVVLRKFLMN